MEEKELKQFMKDFDLGWNEDCYTIAKTTFEREVMKMKKQKEFNLSEREFDIFEPVDGSTWFNKRDVKKFIKRLKEELDKKGYTENVWAIIDKLAGDKLK